MTATSSARRFAAVPERFRWVIPLLTVAAAASALVAALTLVADVVQAVAWAQPHAEVATTFDSSVALPPAGTRDEYAGGPFVADGVRVEVTAVRTTVSGLDLPVRLALGLAPVLWDATIVAVALLVLRCLREMRHGASFTDRSARALIAAAATLAIGSTIAQALGMLAKLGFGRVMWEGWGFEGLGGSQRADFSLTPLTLSAALLVIALLVRRTAALQHDSDVRV